MRRITVVASVLIVVAAIAALYAQQPKSSPPVLRLDTIKLPEGFTISIWAQGVNNARQMAVGSKGTVFVGSLQAGLVHAVVDTDGDHKADKTYVIAKGLGQPSGVAFKDGALYVADISKIYRFDDIEAHLATPPKPVLITSEYPTEGHHGWKFIAFGPDGWLYVPVGAPCNVCDKRGENPVFASVTRIKPDGSGREVWTHGIRNSVGFDWHPITKGLFLTSNGRDMMGDDVPPDTLNYAPKAGMDFGFPYCHAGDVADPEFGSKRQCSEFTKPAQKLGAHVAAIGARFYTGTAFPAEYRNQLFIAEHGSWNRTTPVGYRVTVVTTDAQADVTGYKPFAEGWLQGREAWGRPADVQPLPDGSLLVSDDKSDVIYRISYGR
ncbi:putative membrane-bound dehydrogenase domain protein [Luteitalea pratensis]|uniref:Putative membrane-bound dehydrogenase domain protein n=1 Tax=Luteitalea pratensis TaxID=1855912 RepID=A0A143PFK1_LUTPR|nr:PQQ-dependent sugar dehydrogenase [Luteitalea pratensis]AMY06868.1 putative membrane-bound dehydrogenase domain protein [Luteitalea pratensis]